MLKSRKFHSPGRIYMYNPKRREIRRIEK